MRKRNALLACALLVPLGARALPRRRIGTIDLFAGEDRLTVLAVTPRDRELVRETRDLLRMAP